MKAFAACLLPFIFLATLNSAGYRYGASDQAFYIPAVLLRLDPSLYPRDRVVLSAQAPLTGADEFVAGFVWLTGLSVPATCAVLYVLSLLLLALAAWRIGGLLYATPWASVALLVALTLRHAVPDSGTNTLEGYFHPRQLAFALGAMAIAAFLRRRTHASAAALAIAAILHPTTVLWFAICLGVAALVAERQFRLALIALAVAAAAGAVWAVTAGPLAPRLVVMDEAWLMALADKDYLFPLRWSWDAWLVNLAYLPVILWIYRSMPLNAAGVALAVQLQPGRVFWVLDFVAVAYLVWRIGEGDTHLFRPIEEPKEVNVRVSRAVWLAAALLLFSVTRGGYLYLVMFPDRPVAEVYLRDDDWGRAMAWAQTTDVKSGWLADPIHAAIYGSSVRLAGRRDVLVEALKDGALGLYDRAVAMRTQERLEAIGNFDAMTTAHARALAGRYDLDYLITEQRLQLPVAFESGALRVYTLRP
jgi:hypothetical protein